jgi:hypothetical protein
LRIVFPLVAIGLLLAVRLANRVVPDKSPANLTASLLVTAEGEKEQRHLGQIEAQGEEPTPPDRDLYGTYREIKPVPGETYPDYPLGDPRPSNSSPAVGFHFPE